MKNKLSNEAGYLMYMQVGHLYSDILKYIIIIAFDIISSTHTKINLNFFVRSL